MNDEYSGPDRDGFVLSSAEFGDAYLAQGWARDFIRDVLDRHIAVFVGYSADDPPIRYLLEGLRQSKRHLHKIYAFQVGPNAEAAAQWHEKGVIPIAYDLTPEGNHENLWNTLKAWASRTKDVTAWRRKIFAMARKGPSKLLPHQRGMVAHLVKSQTNARAFARATPPLPSEWLCVFDPAIRFAQAEHRTLQSGDDIVDAYADFSLDDDPPRPGQNEDLSNTKTVPDDAWNAFDLNTSDHAALNERHLAHIRGRNAHHLPELPPRLNELAFWISKVAYEPTTVWWAARQYALHQDIVAIVRWHLEKATDSRKFKEMAKAWHALFEYNEQPNLDDRYTYLDFQNEIRNGWTRYAVRQYGRLFAPRIKIDSSLRDLPPRNSSRTLRRRDYLRVSIKYPEGLKKIAVPNDHLASVVSVQRNNLEKAVDLELDYSSYLDLCSIESEEEPTDDDFARGYAISGYTLHFVDLFRRLITIDLAAAKREFVLWSTDNYIFVRLKIWAASLKIIASAREYADLLLSVTDRDFWPFKGNRDLLLGLASRWSGLKTEDRKKIENRILKGPPKWPGASKEEYEKHSAHTQLSRLHWLAKQGCTFSFDLGEKTHQLKSLAIRWKPEFADNAATSQDSRAGWVKTDTSWAGLKSLPLSEIAEAARRLAGRSDFESLVDYAPFSGLCDEKPVKALSVIRLEQKRAHQSSDLWEIFLSRERRKSDRLKTQVLTTLNLTRLPNEEFAKFARTASQWFEKAGPHLSTAYPILYGEIWDKFLEAIRTDDECGSSALVRAGSDIDWSMEALNSPAGNLAQLLMTDPLKEDLNPDQGFPQAWKIRVEQLLDLPNDSRRFSIVIFTFHLDWFFTIDPQWTERIFLQLLDKGDSYDSDKQAFWAGFMWGARTPHSTLYIRLRPHLLKMAAERTVQKRRHDEILSGILLAGWGSKQESGNRYIESTEFRNVLLNADASFHMNILWNLDRWSDNEESKWPEAVIEFLREVWPKHKKIKTSKISAKLCEIALSQETYFPEVVTEVVKLVTPIEDEHVFIPELRKPGETQAHRHPKEMLDLLYAVLPTKSSAWPYGAADAIKVIEETNPALLRDHKLIELKSRVNDP